MAEKRILDLYFSSQEIVYFHNGAVTAVPLEGEGNEALEALFRSILEAHSATYSTIRVILSPLYMQLNQFTLPAMKKSDLMKVIERKVSVLQGFEEGRNWGYQTLNRIDRVDTIVTYVVAHSLVKTIISVATEKGMLIHSILPLPLLPYLTESGVEGDGSVLLILLKNSVLVRVHKNKKTLFTREFSCKVGAEDPAEVTRLQKEVERTLLYVKQQYQIFSPSIYYVGREYQYINESVPGIYYAGSIPNWVIESVNAIESGEVEKANILPRSYIEERKKIRRFYLLFVTVLIGLAISLLSYLFIHKESAKAEKQVKLLRIDESMDSLQQVISAMEQIEGRISIHQSVISHLESESHAPLAGWTVSYISKIIPERLLLSRFDMHYVPGGDYWQCRLEGFAPRSAVEAALQLKVFEERLQKAPVALTVDKTWLEQWKENLHVGDTREKELVNKQFFIEGRIF